MNHPAALPVIVVIPAFNEGRVVRSVVEGVLACGHQVIVVDDCSIDDTGAALTSLPCTVLRHVVNLGQGAALQTGIEEAVARGAEVVVTFDADGQHDPADIARLVHALADPALDVALGSRFLGDTIGMTQSRKLLLRAAILFTRWTTGLTLTDVHNGLRAFRARVAPQLVLRQNRMAHASELLSRVRQHGLRFVEVPVTIRYSAYSRAKGQSALGALDVLSDLLQMRFFS